MIGDLRIYLKELEDGSRAAGFCNFGLEKVNISCQYFEKLGVSGKQQVRDLWRQQDITSVDIRSGSLAIEVLVQGVVLYKLTAV